MRFSFPFRLLALASLVSSIVSFPSSASEPFPKSPDPRMTPGSLCTTSRKFRYKEQIRYCERSVSKELKQKIIQRYDERLGYRIRSMSRGDFKVDHYIPLCMGGSNEADNLWPQHKSIYEETDLLEQHLCEKMAAGKLLQKDAIAYIKQAKNDLKEAPRLLSQILAL